MIRNILQRFTPGSEDKAKNKTDDPAENQRKSDLHACSVSGHAFEDGERTHYGYFARKKGLSSRRSTTFVVYEKYWFECPKCGQTDHQKDTIGEFKVESGELKELSTTS